ncbi:Uu.00g104970.m01.CDS01 [Anthostomella pinea]|uniref:Uu.00g104970.m01.CDS01 n=1 Tax=Anthostomella pinea TaxID=933095 RepID=A0AAI8YFN2_9PEZI|nr:Uu.00g104970.m01.CDS01 [Anthostomella pinea]
MKVSQITLLGFLGCSSLALAKTFPRFRPGHFKRDGNSTTTTMLQLSTDAEFQYQLVRALSVAPYLGSDIGELLIAVNRLTAGDMDSYYAAFNALATRVHDTADAINVTKYPVSVRDARFREATYWRSADFFLHGNWSDPRINSLWASQTAAFDDAIALLSTPGERVTLPSAGGNFSVPAIFYGTGLPGRRPTLIMCSGMDGSQEEMYHIVGAAALQRGMNVITFEGPGQPTVRRDQDLGFIPEWEEVVTPVVNYALTRDEVDGSKLGLLGQSFGGYLAPRAAAFEHRLAAVMAIDGIYDFGQGLLDQFGSDFTRLFDAGNATAFNNAIDTQVLNNPDAPTSAVWGIQQGMWAFNVPTPYEWISRAQNYTLDGIAGDIKVPVFVGESQDDDNLPGQPKALADALGDLATYHLFESVDGAGLHCAVGASVLANQVVLDWFEDIVSWDQLNCDSEM